VIFVDLLEKERYIFGSIFFLSNKLQTILDRSFRNEGFTTKQLFMTLVIQQFGDVSPTINDLANVMGTSHQNVKQIALKLEKRGFVRIERDKEDRRSVRVTLTQMSESFWKERVEEGKDFLAELFDYCRDEEVEGLYRGLKRLSEKVQILDNPKKEVEQ